MSEVIKNKTYFFLTKSVFAESTKSANNSSLKFLQKSVLMKLMHRTKINPHIVFYPQDGVYELKTEFGNKFESIMELGENMFHQEFNSQIKGDINNRVLLYATDMDGELPDTDKVKVVYADKLTENFFKGAISHDYPIELIGVDNALEELKTIEKEFGEGKTYLPENIEISPQEIGGET